MKVEATQVQKLTITEVPDLDTVSVFLEDLGGRPVPLLEDPGYITRAGQITIECWRESWSAYWGGMGNQSLSQFFTTCSVDYLVGCLARGAEIDRSVFSGSALCTAARRCVLDCRRGRTSRWERMPLDREDARRLYDEAAILSQFSSAEALMYSEDAGEVLTQLFGEEWHYAVSDHAMVEHPKRRYLARIVEAVQQALNHRCECGTKKLGDPQLDAPMREFHGENSEGGASDGP